MAPKPTDTVGNLQAQSIDVGFLTVKGVSITPSGLDPITTAGDIIIGDVTGTPVRLPAGAAGRALIIDGATGLPAWIAVTEAQVTGLVADLASKAPLASPVFTGTVTVPAPANATDAATKAYADGLANGLSVKPSVRVGTTAALPANTYLAGVLTAVANGALTVDGVTVAVNDRVLVKNEVAGANNGIYVVTAAGSGGAPYVLTRSADMNQASEFPGAFVFVESGAVNGGNGFVVASAGPFVIGTTVVTWTQFSGTGVAGSQTNEAQASLLINAFAGVDHFLGSVLDASWTLVNVPDNPLVVKNSMVSCFTQTAIQIWKPMSFPAAGTPFAIEARVRVNSPTNARRWAEIDVTDGALAQIAGVVFDSVNGFQFYMAGAQRGGNTLIDTSVFYGQPFYWRIARTAGNIYSAYWSWDRVSWFQIGTASVATATAAARAQLWWSGAGGLTYVGYDFIDTLAA